MGIELLKVFRENELGKENWKNQNTQNPNILILLNY